MLWICFSLALLWLIDCTISIPFFYCLLTIWCVRGFVTSLLRRSAVPRSSMMAIVLPSAIVLSLIQSEYYYCCWLDIVHNIMPADVSHFIFYWFAGDYLAHLLLWLHAPTRGSRYFISTAAYFIYVVLFMMLRHSRRNTSGFSATLRGRIWVSYEPDIIIIICPALRGEGCLHPINLLYCFHPLAASDLVWLDSFLPSSLEPRRAILLITAVVRSMAYFSLYVFLLVRHLCGPLLSLYFICL